MKLLIRIQCQSELAIYEALALALTLATFEHQVQLYFDTASFGALLAEDSRTAGMLKSLPLYDMPPAWLSHDVMSGWLLGMVDDEIASQLTHAPEPIDLRQFQQVLSF